MITKDNLFEGERSKYKHAFIFRTSLNDSNLTLCLTEANDLIAKVDDEDTTVVTKTTKVKKPVAKPAVKKVQKKPVTPTTDPAE